MLARYKESLVKVKQLLLKIKEDERKGEREMEGHRHERPNCESKSLWLQAKKCPKHYLRSQRKGKARASSS
jgi:hypothetical protein